MPLAILTCLFNPQGYCQPRRNFLRFLRQLAAENIPVYAAELAIGDEEWILPESTNVLRLRTTPPQVLWFKENLLNLVEAIVPPTFDRLAWLDCGIVFQRLDLYLAANDALD